MTNVRYLSDPVLTFNAAPGTTPAQCVQDALAVAATEQVSVTFVHNNHVYTVNYREIVMRILEGKRMECKQAQCEKA